MLTLTNGLSAMLFVTWSMSSRFIKMIHVTFSDSSVSRLQVLPASCGSLDSVSWPISGRLRLPTSCHWPRAPTPPEPPSPSASSLSLPGSVSLHLCVNLSPVRVFIICLCVYSSVRVRHRVCLCVYVCIPGLSVSAGNEQI